MAFIDDLFDCLVFELGGHISLLAFAFLHFSFDIIICLLIWGSANIGNLTRADSAESLHNVVAWKKLEVA